MDIPDRFLCLCSALLFDISGMHSLIPWLDKRARYDRTRKSMRAHRSRLYMLFQSYTDNDSIVLLTVSKPVLTRIPTLATDC
jgi:hypothetical protein